MRRLLLMHGAVCVLGMAKGEVEEGSSRPLAWEEGGAWDEGELRVRWIVWRGRGCI
jgi:hypothetical protein